ncbi:zinc finger CCHC domain-containing protein 3-like [Trichomycterus rosablanca]|uniref:zinc finger CCHC domain-containing protein 3-like n=1 Tax=Trichomycterus rosablanca TaxID=2290929 RepID=UPI002F35CCE1
MFCQLFNAWIGEGFWKNWNITSSAPQDIVHIIIKFWTGRIADEDVNCYIRRYCEILQPPDKPVDQFGIWYGVRRYKVKLRTNENGEIQQLPNTIAMGPYVGKISYPGQIQRCYICNSAHHQVKDCDKTKCWKCGQFGHKAKDCVDVEQCGLCGQSGHSYFTCPKSFSNLLKKERRQAQPNLQAPEQTTPETKDPACDKPDNNDQPQQEQANKESNSSEEESSGSTSSDEADSSDEEDDSDSESSEATDIDSTPAQRQADNIEQTTTTEQLKRTNEKTEDEEI